MSVLGNNGVFEYDYNGNATPSINWNPHGNLEFIKSDNTSAIIDWFNSDITGFNAISGTTVTGSSLNDSYGAVPASTNILTENGSGAYLTSLTAANLTAGGTFPAENSVNLTNLPVIGTMTSSNGYYTFTKNGTTGTTNAAFTLTNLAGLSGGGSGNANTNQPTIFTNLNNEIYVFTNGVDDTTNIQTALNSGGHVKLNSPGGTYLISSPLIYSNLNWLDGGSGVTIKELAGNNCVMGITPAVTTNLLYANIHISGITWDDNWTNNPGLAIYGQPQNFLLSNKNTNNAVRGAGGTFCFFGCSNLLVEDCSWIDPNHFGIQVAGCQNVVIQRCHPILTSTNPISDGFHIGSPLLNLTIRDCYGVTADDFVALNAWDWLDSCPFTNAANIVNVDIENISGNCVWSPVKMCTGAANGVQHVRINNVTMTSTNNGFIWGSFPDGIVVSHTTGVGNIEDISARNVAITVNSSSTSGGDTYGSACYLKCNAYGVSFEGVEISNAIHPFLGQPWLKIGTNNLTIPNVSFRDVRLVANNSVQLANVNGNATEINFDHEGFLQIYNSTAQTPSYGTDVLMSANSINQSNFWTSLTLGWNGSSMTVTQLVSGTMSFINQSSLSSGSGLNGVSCFRNGSKLDYFPLIDVTTGVDALRGFTTSEHGNPGDVWTLECNIAAGTINPNILIRLTP
jgi:hypothetical protein